MGIGRGVVVKSRKRSFVVFPLLGISGSDFSTLDLVSVLASLPFHGRGGEKEGGVPSQFESLISELNATAGRCRPRRGIRPSLRQRRLRLLKPGEACLVGGAGLGPLARRRRRGGARPRPRRLPRGDSPEITKLILGPHDPHN